MQGGVPSRFGMLPTSRQWIADDIIKEWGDVSLLKPNVCHLRSKLAGKGKHWHERTWKFTVNVLHVSLDSCGVPGPRMNGQSRLERHLAGYESSTTVMSSELDTTSFCDSEDDDTMSRWEMDGRRKEAFRGGRRSVGWSEAELKWVQFWDFSVYYKIMDQIARSFCLCAPWLSWQVRRLVCSF